ncbi:hypothetical protein IAQ61_011708 [Plenodomus lingam]|nr:hypothetical protein IAQ61_011708 [Plenodomus lingam]
MPTTEEKDTSLDKSKTQKPEIDNEQVRQESSRAACAAMEAQKKADELKKAAAGAGDADERQKLMEQAIEAQIEAESFGKTAKYMRSGAFQGLAMGTGLGAAPGVTLGAITGTLVGSVSSTLLGSIGGGIGAAAGAINGPFWDLSKFAGKGIRKITGDLPSWAASDEQKKALEKMLDQVNDEEMPDKQDLKGFVEDGGGADMDEGWLKKMKSCLPSLPSLTSSSGAKQQDNDAEKKSSDSSDEKQESALKTNDQPRKKPRKLEIKSHSEQELSEKSTEQKQKKPRKLETRSKHVEHEARESEETKAQPPK